MKTVVVGHRGTGKTELLQRLQLYLGERLVEIVDLDTEIEKKIGKTIPELFLEHGENYFRELERQLFLEILQKPHAELYLVLGAGFDLSVIPEEVRVLWVKRQTDLDGRIFLNRPRLNPELSPLEEFRKRAEVREKNYHARADEVYLMPEGIFENHHKAMAVEKSILLHTYENIGGGLTVLPEVFKTEASWNLFKMRYRNKGISFFELRDDLLSDEHILRFVSELPEEAVIFSFRKDLSEAALVSSALLEADILGKAKWVDWAWELGVPERLLQTVPANKVILSLHNAPDFSEWSAYERHVGHMKYAPEVGGFFDLEEGQSWQKQDPQRRSFLPRSISGVWAWYRLLKKGKQLINFWREGRGSAGDQPSLWQWLMTLDHVDHFAAVLGAPVAHSFTPLEQSDFFSKRSRPVFAIDIPRHEWDVALPLLRNWGLTHAAVTSPHKENAARLCSGTKFKALNTLYWNESTQQWLGHSTDDQGFLDLIEGVGMIAPLQKEIFVWGGGGTLEMIEKALPHASYFSSRTAQPRPGSEGAQGLQPKIVIWAAPRTSETLMPPKEWNPAMVFDLNYKEDSMGREYAQRCEANYQSGLVMFLSQAQGQRQFWKDCEESQ